MLCRVGEHRKRIITSLTWQTASCDKAKNSDCFFVGDDTGLVTQVNVPKTKVSFSVT